jgi:NDP-sugar pyrophosphorylase family protein
MTDIGYDPEYPKHLLPLHGHSTLLGEITHQAGAFGRPVVHANSHNVVAIAESASLHPSTLVALEREQQGPMGPLARELMRCGGQVLACAGDFYANIDWRTLTEFHDGHGLPMTIVVAQSTPADSGATFSVDENNIVDGWKRVERTSATDLINIGIYIADMVAPVARIMSSGRFSKNGQRFYKEDDVNDAMIEAGLMAAYVLPDMAYNVNSPEVYHAMQLELAGLTGTS